jgi:signal transduction histidine kinase
MPSRERPAFAPAPSHAGPESISESSLFDRSAIRDTRLSRWMGWRLKLLACAALAGCLALLMVARWAGGTHDVAASWRSAGQGHIQLDATPDPALEPYVGRLLIGMMGSSPSIAADVAAPNALALHASSRWLVEDAERRQYQRIHGQIDAVMSHPSVTLFFDDGSLQEVRPVARGVRRLSALFWVLSTMALALYMVGMVVLLARPSWRNAAYALMALCQAGNLVLVGVGATLSLHRPSPLPELDMSLVMALDLVTAAALIHAVCLHPLRLPAARWIALAAWSVTGLTVGLAHEQQLQGAWWWTQLGVMGMGLASLGLLTWSYRLERNPLAMVLRRFGAITVGMWALLTFTAATVFALPGLRHDIANIGSMIWYVYFALLLGLIPFLSRSQLVMREFAVLASVSTVATLLDLMFVAVFSFGQFASLTLALFLSLGLYIGTRQWLVNRLLGGGILTTERMFGQLYRIAREVEVRPDRVSVLLCKLLRDLFEPLEVAIIDRPCQAARVVSDGSTLLMPIPSLHDADVGTQEAIMMRFASRGRRLFTSEDARLADRIIEQLRRAVAFDRAVEQGRSEERLRLAQDLHDDIGARLLTLMYKAQSPEIEEYVRHTLQDLKTLTRGLAAANHFLSHAAAEWKTDLTHRLNAAHITLGWSFNFDEDVQLSVVQWSALTRILRELVSNVISHAHARRVEVEFHLSNDHLELSISDDGVGRNPKAWAHGLGLGGVRKRVKQLGGEVSWHETHPCGIACRVVVKDWSKQH